MTDTEDFKALFDNKFSLMNEENFTRIFHHLYKRMCLFAYKYMEDWDDAEDVVGEVFMKLWGKDLNFENEAHLLTYLYQAIKHTVINVNQQKSKSEIRNLKFSEQFLKQVDTDYLLNITYVEGLNELYSEIQKLPPQAKKVIVLYFLEGKSNAEIAEQLQISLQTVKNNKHRAIKILRKNLSEDPLRLLYVLGLSQSISDFI